MVGKEMNFGERLIFQNSLKRAGENGYVQTLKYYQ